ncbi:Uncharacterised protein [Chromobacterium violaceum]|uniref:Uncharacterized protein n=1 Tax=Chromobacterium violaceum TaxID=536 RepID=A0A447TFZ6_CHRVL|nr:Uncharacterised protein [Chromobacterium violaceum]
MMRLSVLTLCCALGLSLPAWADTADNLFTVPLDAFQPGKMVPGQRVYQKPGSS